MLGQFRAGQPETGVGGFASEGEMMTDTKEAGRLLRSTKFFTFLSVTLSVAAAVVWVLAARTSRSAKPAGQMSASASPRSAVPRRVTVPLFDGQSTKGWVETSGHWQVKSGSLSGYEGTQNRVAIAYRELLPAEFDLTLSVSNSGALGKGNDGTATVQLTDDARRDVTYGLVLVWGRELYQLGTSPDAEFHMPPKILILGGIGRNLLASEEGNLSANRLYTVSCSVRHEGLGYALDGKQVGQRTIGFGTASWRLELQNEQPTVLVGVRRGELRERQRDRTERWGGFDSETVWEMEPDRGGYSVDAGIHAEFSAIEMTLPAGAKTNP
jgi:hypothetical protein